MQAIPSDIRNLPTYIVSRQLFSCTIILILILCILAIAFFLHWVFRSYFNYINSDYLVDFEIILEEGNHKQTNRGIESQQQYISSSQSSSPQYTLKAQTQSRFSNRAENSMLQFICLIVVIVININSFTSLIMETVCFGVTVLLFIFFNILRKYDDKMMLRMLYLIPLILCYIPFYAFSKSLGQR